MFHGIHIVLYKSPSGPAYFTILVIIVAVVHGCLSLLYYVLYLWKILSDPSRIPHADAKAEDNNPTDLKTLNQNFK